MIAAVSLSAIPIDPSVAVANVDPSSNVVAAWDKPGNDLIVTEPARADLYRQHAVEANPRPLGVPAVNEIGETWNRALQDLYDGLSVPTNARGAPPPPRDRRLSFTGFEPEETAKLPSEVESAVQMLAEASRRSALLGVYTVCVQ